MEVNDQSRLHPDPYLQQKRYAQPDKEALAIVFGVTFHVYLYGHSFTIHSDHYSISSTLAKLFQLWLLPEYSVGHYSLIHINIQFLISQDLRWLMQMC